jgi:hypothetical protein
MTCCGNKQRQVGVYPEPREASDAGSAGDFALELVNEFFLFLQQGVHFCGSLVVILGGTNGLFLGLLGVGYFLNRLLNDLIHSIFKLLLKLGQSSPLFIALGADRGKLLSETAYLGVLFDYEFILLL